MRRIATLWLAVGLLCLGSRLGAEEKIKAVVLTGGHGFDKNTFFTVFDGHPDIAHAPFPLKDHSEIFEDISQWDYDVIVFFNMTQKISEKRQKNLLMLLDRGIGVVIVCIRDRKAVLGLTAEQTDV